MLHQNSIHKAHRAMAMNTVLLGLLVCCAAAAEDNQTLQALSYQVIALPADELSCASGELRTHTQVNITTSVVSLLQSTIVPQIVTATTQPPLLQCPCLSGAGTRIALLNMSAASHQCPAEWREISSPRRSCGRNSNSSSCQSVFYTTNGVSYSRVCGRVIAHQYCAPNAFSAYNEDSTMTIDDAYVDGISITHGSNPRKHIWTFAAATYESYTGHTAIICPCTNHGNSFSTGFLTPPFVGNDYFCDSGLSSFRFSLLFCSLQASHYINDPLWDGSGCGPSSTCCQLNNPPWFCKTLPQPTTDDIEVRICADESASRDDTPVELIELYIS